MNCNDYSCSRQMDISENFFKKCRTCQYCFTKNDDDYVYCRKRNGKCEYKPYKSRKELRGEENGTME